VYNVLVGSVSFATTGPKALQNASTAQEIEVITPSAKNFEFRVNLVFMSMNRTADLYLCYLKALE
jgi:hypothetical protein